MLYVGTTQRALPQGAPCDVAAPFLTFSVTYKQICVRMNAGGGEAVFWARAQYSRRADS